MVTGGGGSGGGDNNLPQSFPADMAGCLILCYALDPV